MRRGLVAIGLSLVVLALVVTGCTTGLQTTGAGGIVSQQNTGIWVTGDGKVTVTPDVAILNLGVESQAATVELAQQQARESMAAVMAELDRLGVDKKDIRTQSFTISPVYEWVEIEKKQQLTGYQVTNMVTAKVRKVEDAGTIIDAVAVAGGDYTRITSVDFTVDDPTPYYEQVREKAMADAKAKAEQLADLSRVGLGKPTYISEGGIVAPIYRDVKEAASGAVPAPTTSVTPGEIDITLSIQVVYSIK